MYLLMHTCSSYVGSSHPVSDCLFIIYHNLQCIIILGYLNLLSLLPSLLQFVILFPSKGAPLAKYSLCLGGSFFIFFEWHMFRNISLHFVSCSADKCIPFLPNLVGCILSDKTNRWRWTKLQLCV